MNFLTTFIVVLGLFAQIWAKTPRITRLKPESQTKEKAPNPRRSLSDEALSRYLEKREKQNEILFARTMKPYIWEGDSQIQTGKTYRGILLNSVVSTNLASPLLVRVQDGQGLSHLAKFACHGVSLNLRVHAECHRLILPNKEISIQAQLLNMDGTAGLIGEIDDGKDELMMQALASQFSSGALSLAQSRVASPYGDIRDSSTRNQIYQGLINAGGTASDIYLDEMKNITPTVTIQAGTEVLIYFQEAVNEDDLR